MARGKRNNTPSTVWGQRCLFLALKWSNAMTTVWASSSGAWVPRSEKGFRLPLPQEAAVRATHLNVKRVPMSSIDSNSAFDLGKESR